MCIYLHIFIALILINIDIVFFVCVCVIIFVFRVASIIPNNRIFVHISQSLVNPNIFVFVFIYKMGSEYIRQPKYIFIRIGQKC